MVGLGCLGPPITACARVSCRRVRGGLHHRADDELQLRLCGDVQWLHRHHGRLQHVRYGQGVPGWVAPGVGAKAGGEQGGAVPVGTNSAHSCPQGT